LKHFLISLPTYLRFARFQHRPYFRILRAVVGGLEIRREAAAARKQNRPTADCLLHPAPYGHQQVRYARAYLTTLTPQQVPALSEQRSLLSSQVPPGRWQERVKGQRRQFGDKFVNSADLLQKQPRHSDEGTTPTS